jgi:RHS repeat-associated protein
LVLSPAINVSDFYPFGGERVISTGTPTNYKFTGKERDSESGLDNFGARSVSSRMGRFMSPDWSAAPMGVAYADFGNPQSLNLYSYVKNNRLTLNGPDGHAEGITWNDIWNAGDAILTGSSIGAATTTAVTIGSGGVIVGVEVEAFDLAVHNPHDACNCAVDAANSIR